MPQRGRPCRRGADWGLVLPLLGVLPALRSGACRGTAPAVAARRRVSVGNAAAIWLMTWVGPLAVGRYAATRDVAPGNVFSHDGRVMAGSASRVVAGGTWSAIWRRGGARRRAACRRLPTLWSPIVQPVVRNCPGRQHGGPARRHCNLARPSPVPAQPTNSPQHPEFRAMPCPTNVRGPNSRYRGGSCTHIARL